MNKRNVAALAVAALMFAGAMSLAAQKTTMVVTAENPRECPYALADKARQKVEAELGRAGERLEVELAKAQSKISRELAEFEREHAVELSQELARIDEKKILELTEHAVEQAAMAADSLVWFSSDDEGGWLGVTISEVSAEQAKELKLAAERGVLINGVEAESPAAKAGLKENDLILEYNSQRIEGTVQFRRLVRETPVGRTVQLSVWRDGRAQNVSVALGSRSSGGSHGFSIVAPEVPRFKMNFPLTFDFGDAFRAGSTPILGISGEDLNGQLGQYFGAPEGEGVLVKEVRAGTPAEKAGMKAGDVITRAGGQRVRSLSDLRSALREKREDKNFPVTVLRKGSETTLNVEIEKPQLPKRRLLSRRHTL